jgi:hypothetical protein
MKFFRPLSRDQWTIAIVLLLLALLGLFMMTQDPRFLPTGKSRVDWPPPTPAKP